MSHRAPNHAAPRALRQPLARGTLYAPTTRYQRSNRSAPDWPSHNPGVARPINATALPCGGQLDRFASPSPPPHPDPLALNLGTPGLISCGSGRRRSPADDHRCPRSFFFFGSARGRCAVVGTRSDPITASRPRGRMLAAARSSCPPYSSARRAPTGAPPSSSRAACSAAALKRHSAFRPPAMTTGRSVLGTSIVARVSSGRRVARASSCQCQNAQSGRNAGFQLVRLAIHRGKGPPQRRSKLMVGFQSANAALTASAVTPRADTNGLRPSVVRD